MDETLRQPVVLVEFTGKRPGFWNPIIDSALQARAGVALPRGRRTKAGMLANSNNVPWGSRHQQRIITDCLSVEFEPRPTIEELKVRLLEQLRASDAFTFEILSFTLDYFDQLASTGEEGGWPYYEGLIRRVNDAFADDV